VTNTALSPTRERCRRAAFAGRTTLQESRRHRFKSILVMETAENWSSSDAMSAWEFVVRRLCDRQC
jgi:hypothetical protein